MANAFALGFMYTVSLCTCPPFVCLSKNKQRNTIVFTFGGDLALVASADGTGGELNPSATIGLSTIIQGDGESNRDGRRANFESIFINGTLNIAAAVDQTVSVVPL